MNVIQGLNTLVILIGIPALCGCLLFIGRKLQTLDSLEATVEKIKINVKVIANHLTRNHENFDSSEIQTYSPYKLTSEGENFIKTLGFDRVLEKYKNDFFQYIDQDAPKLKYDVESAAIKAIHGLAAKEYMSFLKVYFYNNPKRTLENTAPTFGVYVRDMYLKEHPEIKE